MALTKVSRGLISTSIVDNGNATAITIDSSENVSFTGAATFSGTVTADGLTSSDFIDIRADDSEIYFTNAANTNYYRIKRTGASGDLAFDHFNGASVSERMRIDASGNLLVGKTSTAFVTEGFVYEAGAAVEVTTDSNRVMRLNRTTSDGNIIELNKDGATVGSIGAKSGDIYIGTGDTGIRFNDTDNAVYGADTTTGSASDGNISLGVSSARFKDLYLSGGVYLGGTGAANKLDDYEEGTWTPNPNYGSYTATACRYTKVGNLVTVSGYISSITDQTSGFAFVLNALPFASQSASSNQGSCFYSYITKTGFSQVCPYIAGNSTAVLFYGTNPATGTADVTVNHADFSNSIAYVYFTITYVAA